MLGSLLYLCTLLILQSYLVQSWQIQSNSRILSKLWQSTSMKSEMNNLSDSNKLLKAVLKGAACSIATFALGFNDMSKTEAGGWNLLHPSPAFAVSGGGKDYATKDLRESDFTGAILDNKDFTQCNAQGTKFTKATLTGSRFYRANLKDADFSGATLIGVSLEDTDLSGATFHGANLKDSYFSQSVLDAKDFTDADFTDSQMPEFGRKKLCERPDVTGTNPATQVDTRESLFCP